MFNLVSTVGDSSPGHEEQTMTTQIAPKNTLGPWEEAIVRQTRTWIETVGPAHCPEHGAMAVCE